MSMILFSFQINAKVLFSVEGKGLWNNFRLSVKHLIKKIKMAAKMMAATF